MSNNTSPHGANQPVHDHVSSNPRNLLSHIFSSPLHCIAFALVSCSAITNGYAAATASAGAMALVAVTASVCSDVLKSSLPVVTRRLLKAGDWATATACAALLIITLMFSGWMAMSAALGTRIESSGGRASIESDRARIQASYDGAVATLKALDATRGIAELQALLANGAGVDAATWTRTAHCTDVTRAASQLACKPFADASAELGRAQRRQEVEAVIKGASAALAALPAPKVPDAGIVAAQRALGLFGLKASDESIQTGAALLFVLLLELGSALGFVVADALAARQPVAAQNVTEAHGSPEADRQPVEARGSPVAAQGLPTASQKPVAAQQQPVAARRSPHWREPGPVVAQTGYSGPQQPVAAHGLLVALAAQGGLYEGTQHDLAAQTGFSRTGLQRALAEAVAAGSARVSTVKGHSTRVELVRGGLRMVN